MSQKVYIFGETGRMGLEVRKIIDQSEAYDYVGGFSRKKTNNNPTESPDIVIDFSLPESLEQLSSFVKDHSPALVSGTTGMTEDQMQSFKKMGEFSPVFWSANMSFGVYLMCELTKTLAKYDSFYGLHVEETHHIHKKDKPSGTALIVENAARLNSSRLQPTISHREGEVFGIHRFIAESQNESLEIKHEAFNRQLFAQGALDISLWVKNQEPGFYTMEDFFHTFDKSPKNS